MTIYEADLCDNALTFSMGMGQCTERSSENEAFSRVQFE